MHSYINLLNFERFDDLAEIYVVVVTVYGMQRNITRHHNPHGGTGVIFTKRTNGK